MKMAEIKDRNKKIQDNVKKIDKLYEENKKLFSETSLEIAEYLQKNPDILNSVKWEMGTFIIGSKSFEYVYIESQSTFGELKCEEIFAKTNDSHYILLDNGKGKVELRLTEEEISIEIRGDVFSTLFEFIEKFKLKVDVNRRINELEEEIETRKKDIEILSKIEDMNNKD